MLMIHVLTRDYMGSCFAADNKCLEFCLSHPSNTTAITAARITHFLSLIRKMILVEGLPYTVASKMSTVHVPSAACLQTFHNRGHCFVIIWAPAATNTNCESNEPSASRHKRYSN